MQGPIQVISIHALREEGDHGLGQRQSTCQQFLSTPSARRATRPHREGADRLEFLSTPSARRATRLSDAQLARLYKFLSTPSARRATRQRKERRNPMNISIHALREEGDSKNRDKISIFKQIIQHSARI